MAKMMLLIAFVLLSGGCENKKGAFIKTVKSQYTTKEGVRKFEKVLEEKGLSVFYVIDHAQNAKNSEMELLPTTLVVFGNPKMGTILMQCNQSMGMDLPLKMLFHSDYEGNHWISYTNPEYYTLKHNIKDKNCLEVIKKANIALQVLADELKETNATAQTTESNGIDTQAADEANETNSSDLSPIKKNE